MAEITVRAFLRSLLAAATLPAGLGAAETPTTGGWTNSLGMRFVPIGSGEFRMGMEDALLPPELAGQDWRRPGNFDEHPAHPVVITRPFHAAVTPVTNAQYEQFAPEHRRVRGKLGYSTRDDEAVVFVSWHEATAFARWLSIKEGKPYRLPTEAEWEYFCRAGTSTHFWTGERLPGAYLRNARESWFPDPARERPALDIVNLTVGVNAPNPWGLHDLHGLVEEWCSDWYGPYEASRQSDPVGPAAGDFRVTRGGSHSTEEYFLRSAARAGTLPDDSSWLIGFRVVVGEIPPRGSNHAASLANIPLSAGRIQVISNASHSTPTAHFAEPKQYVNIPPNSWGPLFSHHNHDPALTECPNGDLLAIWYTCVSERGRELGVAQSRLRRGSTDWDDASVIWKAPSRNNHAPSLYFDGENTIYHFNGLSAAATWGNLALVMRKSHDNGYTWSPARLIGPAHGLHHQPVPGPIRTQNGHILLASDAVTGGNGGSVLHRSADAGEAWTELPGRIAGIHAGIVELRDGPASAPGAEHLMAFGRGDSIDGHMPLSLSSDGGETWQHSASEFPPIGGGQRLVLIRLKEGPILLTSFSNHGEVTTQSGVHLYGFFAALSFDEGRSWPLKRTISNGITPTLETTDGKPFTADATHGEPHGYMAGCQARDGMIHIISSRLHYSFNLEWLKARQ